VSADERTFAVTISYQLPEGSYEPTDDRDAGERSYTIHTTTSGMAQILDTMDEVEA